MKKETKLWLDIAEEDFKDMQVMREAKRYRGAVLFAQQCVEKVIKAYIVETRGVTPRKIHIIEELCKDALLDLADIDNPNVKELSKAYARVRYTDLSAQYFSTAADTTPLLIMAQKVYLWIHDKLIAN